MLSIPGACRASSSHPPIIHCDQDSIIRMCNLDQSGSWREPIISARAITLFADRAANDRRDLGREQLDHAGNVCKRQAADVDLRKETLMAEQLALIQDLVDDLLRDTDENRAMGGGAF